MPGMYLQALSFSTFWGHTAVERNVRKQMFNGAVSFIHAKYHNTTEIFKLN